jgi:hypothetical protein
MQKVQFEVSTSAWLQNFDTAQFLHWQDAWCEVNEDILSYCGS